MEVRGPREPGRELIERGEVERVVGLVLLLDFVSRKRNLGDFRLKVKDGVGDEGEIGVVGDRVGVVEGWGGGEDGGEFFGDDGLASNEPRAKRVASCKLRARKNVERESRWVKSKEVESKKAPMSEARSKSSSQKNQSTRFPRSLRPRSSAFARKLVG